MDDFSAAATSSMMMDGNDHNSVLRMGLPIVHLAAPNELTVLDNNGNTRSTHDNRSNNNNDSTVNITGNIVETPELNNKNNNNNNHNAPVGQQLDHHSENEQVRWPVSTTTTLVQPPSAVVSPSASSSSSTSVPQSTRCIEAQQIREINYPKPESIDSPEDLQDPTVQTPVEKQQHQQQDPLRFLIQRELCAEQKRKSNSSDLMDLNDVSESSLYERLSQEEAFRDFELTCSAKEIAKVLETFNAILEDGDNSSSSNNCSTAHFNDFPRSDEDGENCMRIVDNFANLLIGGENDDEELLIVVDNSDTSLLPENEANVSNNNNNFQQSQHQQQRLNSNGEQPDDDEDDSLTPTIVDDDVEDYYNPDDTEGYESDRPMVRASMRRLRPVQLLPMPTTTVMSSYTIPESPCPSPGHHNPIGESPIPGVSSISNSPAVLVPGSPLISNHNILVTSLVNNPSSSELDHSNSTDLLSTEFRVVNEVNNPIYGDVVHHPQVSRVPSGGQVLLATSVAIAGASITSTSAAACSPTEIPAPGTADTTNDSPSSSSRSGNGQSSTSVSTSSSSSSSSSTSTNTSSSGVSSSNSTPNRNTNSSNIRTENVTITTSTTTNATSGREWRPLRWPHRLSSVLAVIGCTLGLTNICRFSLLSVEYGANFILQFLFLSVVFGIPLLTFHMSIGQYLSSGIIDMWKISPIFKGIGIGLVISQAVIGIYTAVGVSWVFIYFRDSFITRYDQYRWGKCFREYRDCNFSLSNQSNLAETVPDYFNGVVLQRSTVDLSSPTVTSGLKFTVAFNLAVVWMLIFVSLSKGLKSYGKVIHGLILIPIAGLLVLASKVVGLVPTDQGGALFTHTAWSNFFFNSQTWVVAAREAFFTWGLLGACVMQVTSHNRFGHNLKSDASIVVLITTFVLLLGAFLGNACYSVITANQYNYTPSSFETPRSAQFLHAATEAQPDTYLFSHISFLMGARILPQELNNGKRSGYQALRLATELFPTTMAMLSSTGLSPFWTVLFYFILILFGIAQLVAIWHCVIRAVVAIKPKVLRAWEITIAVCVCSTGFVLGLPLCTELGIFIEYFLDYVVGSGWWIIVLYLLELVAVFIVRGAPYCGENIVTVLMTGPGKLMAILGPLLSFVWNVILPVAMLVLSIASFKSGNIRELYDWNPNHGYEFWPSWTRELGSLMQLLPILAVPFVAIVQSCRYLSNGPPDLFERMQRLYRPSSRGLFNLPNSPQASGNNSANNFANSSNAEDRNEDPPPKYTPPPSYSTATGAKIAKFLRSSMRRSMRRFTGASTSASSTADLPPPPAYSSVILEINAQQLQQQQSLCNSTATTNPATNTGHSVNTALTPILMSPTTTDVGEQSDAKPSKPASQTLGKTLGESKERASLRRIASDITPRDIARLLRASFRRSASPERSQSASSEQNNLSRTLSSPQQTSGGTPQHSAFNIEVDFLRIPSNSDIRLNFSTSGNYGMDGSQSFTQCENSGRAGRANVHIRSVSTGGTFMNGQHRNSTTDSQTTLISHSSSQNDLSHLLDNSSPAVDFRLRGIVNPSFQFSHHSVHTLRNGHDSLNQSDA